MDRLNHYRSLIERHLTEIAAYCNRGTPKYGDKECVFDEQNDQYLIVSTGWSERRRIYDTYLHVRIRGGKIWVEEDNTEVGIATILERSGVPATDIVLAFHPPELRDLTAYGAA